MSGMRVAVAVMVLAVLAVTAWQALRPGDRIAGTNVLGQGGFVATIPAGDRALCQGDEPLPAGAASAELVLGVAGGPPPPLRLTIRQEGEVLARGALDGGWAGGPVRIPITTEPLERGAGPVQVCLRKSGPAAISVAGDGGEPAAVAGGQPQVGRVGITYFAERDSIAGQFATFAERLGRGNASWLGSWAGWLVALLAVASLGAAAATLLSGWREQRAGATTAGRRLPRTVRLGGLAAGLAGLAFALLTPPLQVPDEENNLAYTMFLAEGRFAKETEGTPYPGELRVLRDGLTTDFIKGRPYNKPPWTAEQEAGLRGAEATEARREPVANASAASGNPPLYYALGLAPYALTPGSLLDKLLAMRLLSVLLGVVTVLAAGLFLRELLPRSPALAAAGALAVAFQPKFAFMSGGYNADALLFAASAVTLLAMTRLLRHGPTARRAVLLGLAMVCGIMAKPLFLGLVPPAVLALGIAVWRAEAIPWRRRLGYAAAGLAIAFVPVVVYSVVAGALADHPYFPQGTTVSALSGNGNTTTRPSWWDQLSYIWQLYLPRVPPLMQTDFFFASTTLRDIWTSGFVGAFGYMDYTFSATVQVWAFRILVAVGLLAAAALVVHWRGWRGRRVELLVYAFAVVCVAGAIGVQDYRAQQITSAFRQARYLLPLLVLYGGLIGVALRLFGPRLGSYAGVLVVGLASGHLLASMLLTVSRYYL